LSQIGDLGAEHVDHKFDNLVSEFVWLRTGVGPRKDFFVRDADGNKRYVEEKESEGEGACLWFDDHHTHSIDPVVEPRYSIRIDGIFNDKFRHYICRVGTFCSQSPDGATLGGLCGVLRAQGAGTTLSVPASKSRKTAIDKARVACAHSRTTAVKAKLELDSRIVMHPVVPKRKAINLYQILIHLFFVFKCKEGNMP
jgi:hypothetical protein